jgi:hypothetical protein
METVEFNLNKYRGPKSTLYTGRPQGEAARKDLGLDQFDSSPKRAVFVIPRGTTSFNPSFYLGLLFESFSKLGLGKFEEKYVFRFEDENPNVVAVLEENLNDGKRNAINTLNNNTGFSRFIKNKK